MITSQERLSVMREKREWIFIFSFLIFLVTLNIIFICINWFIWKDDNVTIVTTVTSIINLAVCLIYWFIAMNNKFKKTKIS